MFDLILIQLLAFVAMLSISVVSLHLSTKCIGVNSANWGKALVVSLITGVISVTVSYLLLLVAAFWIELFVIFAAQVVLVRNYYKVSIKIALSITVIAAIFAILPAWLFYKQFDAVIYDSAFQIIERII